MDGLRRHVPLQRGPVFGAAEFLVAVEEGPFPGREMIRAIRMHMDVVDFVRQEARQSVGRQLAVARGEGIDVFHGGELDGWSRGLMSHSRNAQSNSTPAPKVKTRAMLTCAS